MPAEPAVLVDVSDGTARVVLNRPNARNAVNLAMCIALRDAFDLIAEHAGIRVVLVSGTGPSFCAGADLKERVGRDAGWVLRRRRASFAAYEAVERCTRPVVALLHGTVVGSGGEIAMACDFAIATSDATFQFPEPRWGTVGATQRLQRAIGKRRAKELLYTGRVVDADEAERIGLVVRTVPPEGLQTAGDEVARAITDSPELAMALTKQSIDLGEETDLDRGIRIELAAIERCLADDEWKAGVAGFNHAEPSADGEMP